MNPQELNIHYREGTSDEWVVKEIFEEKVYDIDIAPPKVIVDIGANIGVSALWFAMKWPEAKIYAFEPQGENFQFLLKNTKRYPNIFPYMRAVSDFEGTARLFAAAESHKHGYSLCERDSPSEMVRVCTLPQWIHEQIIDRIDLLKIDCEGAEGAIFKSLGPLLDKIDAVVGEIHGEPNNIVLEMLRKDFEVSAPPDKETFSAIRRTNAHTS